MNRTLALLVDSTRDGVVVTDSSGRIVVANPAFLALVDGVSEDAVRNQSIGAWLGRIDTDVAALLAGAHQHGIAHLVRSSVHRSDGTHVDVDVTAALLAEGEQECFGFTIRACATKSEPRAALEQALAALDERIGQAPLAELVAQSKPLIERGLMQNAMARTHGDVGAAAALLGITVEQLLQGLAPDDVARAHPLLTAR
jgi:PAS domain S-box-containing protein